ncbi:MAG: ferritin-like domain-containing protein [Polyangiaceae bacterium]
MTDIAPQNAAPGQTPSPAPHGERRANIDFSALRPEEIAPELLREARVVWADRVRTEYQSIQIAARFATEALAAGEPIRVHRTISETIEEEIRHTEICIGMCRALGGKVPEPKQVAAPLADLGAVPIGERVLATSISLFLISETFSVGYLRDLAERASHPVTKAVMEAITGDEEGHESFGVELCSRLLATAPESARAGWRSFAGRLVKAHLDRADAVLARVPESQHKLELWPETERASLGLLGEVRLALLCRQTYRDRLAPVLAELSLG